MGTRVLPLSGCLEGFRRTPSLLEQRKSYPIPPQKRPCRCLWFWKPLALDENSRDCMVYRALQDLDRIRNAKLFSYAKILFCLHLSGEIQAATEFRSSWAEILGLAEVLEISKYAPIFLWMMAEEICQRLSRISVREKGYGKRSLKLQVSAYSLHYSHFHKCNCNFFPSYRIYLSQISNLQTVFLAQRNLFYITKLSIT